MELKDAMQKRRSIRHYSPKKLDIKDVGEILDLARLAPSAGNLQNWQFVIVTDPKKQKAISDACMDQHWVSEAPMLIVVCNQFEKVSMLYDNLGKMFSVQNCAIIATYIMLLAAEKGFGTCWVGAFDNNKVAEILKMPEEVDPQIILTLGYPDEVKTTEHEREEIRELCYFDEWGEREMEEEGLLDKVKKKIKKT
ncbi:MAG: nitroreductase family protein [Candidatus Woesearchaeota archaeon]